MTYEIGTSICFLVTRPKLREVFAADFRDRIIHHLIMMYLEPLFESVFITDVYNCRKGKGTLYGIKRAQQHIQECTEEFGDCYIAKFDMQGFFMSINKNTLWTMLHRFIKTRYTGPYKNIIMWLTKKIVLHHPEQNCIKKTPERMWNNLDNNKSLFTCNKNCGLPIGNLTSQCFSNFYLYLFDTYMNSIFNHYGRYVDDFFIITGNKQHVCSFVRTISNVLYSVLNITLHPKKRYIQHYTKGFSFIGAIVYKNRTYISNRTVQNFRNAIVRHSMLEQRDSNKFVSVANSYFGFLKHHRTYNIRKDMVDRIDNNHWNKIKTNNNYTKISIS